MKNVAAKLFCLLWTWTWSSALWSCRMSLVCGQINLWNRFFVLEKLYICIHRFLCCTFIARIDEMNWKRLDIGENNVCVKAGNARWTSYQTVKLSFGFGLAVIKIRTYSSLLVFMYLFGFCVNWATDQTKLSPQLVYIYLFRCYAALSKIYAFLICGLRLQFVF